MENLEGEVEAEESALIGAAGGICFVKLFDLKIMVESKRTSTGVFSKYTRCSTL